MRLATSRGVEVPLISLFESNVDLEQLTSLLETAAIAPEQVPLLIRLLRFLLNPVYRNIHHDPLPVPTPSDPSPTPGPSDPRHSADHPLLYGSLLECVARNFGKGFLIAAIGTSLLDLFPVLLRGDLGRAKRVIFAPVHFKNGLAFGLFVASFNSTLFLSSSEDASSRRRVGWLAGLLAGASVSLAPKYARVFTAQLTFTRSLEVGAKWVHREILSENAKRKMEALGISQHLDTALMMGASTVVLDDWLNGGNNLTKNYKKFLNLHGGFDKNTVQAISDQIAGKHTNNASSCDILHPTDASCTRSWGVFFVKAFFSRSVPMYARVFAIPLILGLIQGKHPKKSAVHFVKGVAQSSAFLALYCAGAWATVCASSCWPQRLKDVLRPTFTGVGAGAALLAEKKGRRIEVALFVLTHAIATLMTKYRRNGGKIPAHLDTLVSMVCCSFLLHEFVNEQEGGKKEKIIRPAYRFLLSRFLDTGTHRHHSIVPSVVARSVGSMSKLV